MFYEVTTTDFFLSSPGISVKAMDNKTHKRSHHLLLFFVSFAIAKEFECYVKPFNTKFGQRTTYY